MDVEQRTVTLLHLNEIVVVVGNKSPKKAANPPIDWDFCVEKPSFLTICRRMPDSEATQNLQLKPNPRLCFPLTHSIGKPTSFLYVI